MNSTQKKKTYIGENKEKNNANLNQCCTFGTRSIKCYQASRGDKPKRKNNNEKL